MKYVFQTELPFDTLDTCWLTPRCNILFEMSVRLINGKRINIYPEQNNHHAIKNNKLPLGRS